MIVIQAGIRGCRAEEAVSKLTRQPLLFGPVLEKMSHLSESQKLHLVLSHPLVFLNIQNYISFVDPASVPCASSLRRIPFIACATIEL